jgi:quercetin dioxygenase-like cupin family protein
MKQSQLQFFAKRPGRIACFLARVAAAASAVVVAGVSAYAQGPGPGLAAPQLVLKESVAKMPKSDLQEVRVLTAAFKPGDRTVFHSHRSPVTVYVLEGQFTLDLEGKAPVVVSAGQAFVEPPNVKMTGYNKSTTDPLRVVIFYVSDIGTPFLDPAH